MHAAVALFRLFDGVPSAALLVADAFGFVAALAGTACSFRLAISAKQYQDQINAPKAAVHQRLSLRTREVLPWLIVEHLQHLHGLRLACLSSTATDYAIARNDA